MNAIATAIPDVLILEPTVFSDGRGYFYESFNARRFAELTGWHGAFVQDNHSFSAKDVLRGLHYQVEQPQGKLVRCTAGEIFDVAVDIRPASPTRGRWVGVQLSAQNRRQLWVPPGLAHGFVVLSASAETLYKTTDYYAPQHERALRWNDPALGIAWPVEAPLLSEKDAAAELWEG